MKRFLLSALIALTIMLFGAGSALAKDAPGNNGDIKVHNGSGEPTPITKNEPKVCDFHFHGFNFDVGQEGTYWVTTKTHGPVVLSGSYSVGTNGEFVTQVYSVAAPGLYKLYWQGVGDTKREVKHKTFKVECETQPTPTPTTRPTPTPTPSASVPGGPVCLAPGWSVGDQWGPGESDVIPEGLAPCPTNSTATPDNPRMTLPPTDTDSSDVRNTSPSGLIMIVSGITLLTIAAYVVAARRTGWRG